MTGIGYVHDGRKFLSHVDGKTFKERKIKQLNYTITLEATSEKAYDEISRYLGEAFHHTLFADGKMHYFFNEKETQAVRTDKKSGIEISDLVEKGIIDSVKHILDTERRGNDLK